MPFSGWRNCRWLPFIRFSRHPADSSRSISSLTFTVQIITPMLGQQVRRSPFRGAPPGHAIPRAEAESSRVRERGGTLHQTHEPRRCIKTANLSGRPRNPPARARSRASPKPRQPGLVLRRPLHMIDYHNLHRTLPRLQFHFEAFLHAHENRVPDAATAAGIDRYLVMVVRLIVTSVPETENPSPPHGLLAAPARYPAANASLGNTVGLMDATSNSSPPSCPGKFAAPESAILAAINTALNCARCLYPKHSVRAGPGKSRLGLIPVRSQLQTFSTAKMSKRLRSSESAPRARYARAPRIRVSVTRTQIDTALAPPDQSAEGGSPARSQPFRFSAIDYPQTAYYAFSLLSKLVA